MVNTLEPLVEDASRIDLSEQKTVVAYQAEQKKMKCLTGHASECFTFDGCYSPSSCVDCYTVD